MFNTSSLTIYTPELFLSSCFFENLLKKTVLKRVALFPFTAAPAGETGAYTPNTF